MIEALNEALNAFIDALVRRPALSVSALTSVIEVFGGTEIRAASAGGKALAPLFSCRGDQSAYRWGLLPVSTKPV